MVNGLEQPFPRFLVWSGATLRRVRESVLPDVEPQPVAESVETDEVEVEAPARSRLRVLVLHRVIPATVATLLLLALALVAFRGVYADRVYPAVVVGDVPVGGLTVDQAQSRLEHRVAELERGTVAFTYGGETWTPTLTELGVNADLDASIAEARRLGRGDNATSRLGFVTDILDADQVVPLQMQVDQGALNAWFDKIDRDIDKLPIDARIKIDGTEVAVVPGKDGTVIDREAATAQVMSALTSLEPVAVTLPTEVGHPKIAADDLGEVKADVARLISEPVTVTFDGEDWKVESKHIAPYLGVELELEGGVPVAKLSVDIKGLAGDLRERFSEDINRKPVDAVFSWDDGLFAVEEGENGAALRSDAFAHELADSFLNEHGDVEIPVVVISPEVDHTRLDTYGIDTLLGSGDSNFSGGSWARDENIRVSTELLNHTLVRPGETFSFNEAIGEITYDKGYQEAQVVVGEAVGRDVGGGVCQVSTTVFRAALNTGMPISEWHPHSYRLSNYERDDWGPGFDASILQYGSSPSNWADFKFENYTDSWLLIQAYVWDTYVYVDIYGSGDGRSVEIDAWEIGGNAFGFTRLIYDTEGTVIAERDFETYFL